MRHPARSPRAVIAFTLGLALPVGFLALFFLWPLVAMVGLGVAPKGTINLDGFVDVLLRPRTHRLLWFTLAEASAATVLSIALGLPIAHVLYRLRFRGRAVLRAFIIVPFVLPTVVVGLAFRTLFRESGPLGALGLDGTPAAILLALVFFNIAVVVRTVGSAWENLDPRQEDAARVLGAGPVRVFATITLPRLGMSIAAAASIVFLFCATAFGIVLVLGGSKYGTIETEVYLLTTQFLDLQGASALAITQLALVIVLLLAASRARGVRQARISSTSVARPPRRSDAVAIGIGLLTAAALVLPIAALVERSLHTSEGLGFSNYVGLGGTGSRNALVVPVWVALGNSLAIAAQATLIAMAVGLTASLVLSRTPRSIAARRALVLLDGVIALPLGVSAVTVGFGILVTLNRAPFDLRSSFILVPIAQALVALPLVVRTVLPVLRSLDPRLRESASALGASPARVLRDIDLAVVAKPAAAAAGFAFAISLGEFGATSFLSRPDRPTLPFVIYRLVGLPGDGNLGVALAASVVLAALTVAVIGVLERVRVGAVGAF